MRRQFLLVPFVIVSVFCINRVFTLQCEQGVNNDKCTNSSTPLNETNTNPTTQNQEVTTHTPKPVKSPEALNMLSEEHVDSTVFRPTPIPLSNKTNSSTVKPSISTDEPKGRALNFTIDEHNTGNILTSTNNSKLFENLSDLSDVSIKDEDDDHTMMMMNAKILATKDNKSNSTLGICEKGGLTYENGEKLENGCDSICTCMNGKMDCTDRCSGVFIRKGKKIDDPLCVAKDAEDPCCSVLDCASDTETEPLEMCSYNKTTYNRGDNFNKGCDEVCICEAGGKHSCKPRCAPTNKTSDRCVEVPDPNDSCCKTVLCDVTLDDHEPEKEEELPKLKISSARYVNSSTLSLKFDRDIQKNESLPLIEVSEDKHEWKTYKMVKPDYLQIRDMGKYIKLENTDDIVNIDNLELGPSENDKTENQEGCFYKGTHYKIGDEYNDNCTALCVCKAIGMKCLKMECPTFFGTDVIDPNCIEWETIPPNFVPSPPNCCPENLQCKNNGSCLYEGKMYNNWQQLPLNVTGCEKRCYCEMGNVECQNTCPPVTALPPPTLPCPPHQAHVDHLPEDDCCMYWVCNSDHSTETKHNKTGTKDKPTTNKTDGLNMGPFAISPNKAPSKVLGPLLVYTNKDDETNDAAQLSNATKPLILPAENPFFNKDQQYNNFIPESPIKDPNNNKFVGPINPDFKKQSSNSKPSKPNKNKNGKDSPPIFITPPPNHGENYIPDQGPGMPLVISQTDKDGSPQIQIHGKGTPEEALLQFINQHPELTNLYPSGSVLEIHPVSEGEKPGKPNFANPNNIPPQMPPHNRVPPHLMPYVIPQHGNELPPGFSIEQLLQEIHKNSPPQTGHPLSPFGPNQFNNNNGLLLAQNGPVAPNRPNATFQGPGGNIFPGNFPNAPPYHQQQSEEVSVHILEAIDAHTVRLAFMVPPVIVGLHGRVEVRYTHKPNEDINSWELQVFAPPNDLIATPQLEFDLLDLKADTEYKIKITITLRDLHNTPSSRVYTIKTPKDVHSTTLPPLIPIEPELSITDINATWVTVSWRRFTTYEAQFIDGLQLRYKETDGKIYAATPLIHRSVTSYNLTENLKQNTKYEIGIFFIPFPGQETELQSSHMLQFTTANEIDTYGFNVTLDISQIKSTSVEITWDGVPYPEDKYVNIYRAVYQSDSGKEDHSTFKIAKRDAPTKTVIMDLKPGTRYRLWLEVYLTNGKIKTSNVQDFITKPRAAPSLGASSQQDKLSRGEHSDQKGDYYGPLVIVAILASIAILSTLILLLILVRRHNQNKAAITPPSRVNNSAYDNPTYKVEIQQETMGL